MKSDTSSKSLTADELKELGNNAVKDKKYEEAVLHYSHAIKLHPSNYVLFSNRSFAFFKMQMYYFALEDANETIKLNPTWAKGYFRKGEVEFATYHFADAYLSFQKALELQPNDSVISQAIDAAKKENAKDARADDQIPWLGAGIGIVLGTIIIIADFLYTAKPTHPMLMAITTICIAIFGYGIAKMCRYFVKFRRDAMLQAPDNLIKEPEERTQDNTTKHSTNNKYTKSQARQRYKKGKS